MHDITKNKGEIDAELVKDTARQSFCKVHLYMILILEAWPAFCTQED